jgi:hypothetical protein
LTKKKVNEIYCKFAFPVTTLEQSEIDSFQAFLLALGQAGVINSAEASSETSPFGDVVPSEVEGGVIDENTVGSKGENSPVALTGDNMLSRPFLSNLAAAIFSLPGSFSEGLFYVFLLAFILIVIYMVASLVVGSHDTKSWSSAQVQGRKVLYSVGGVLATIAAVSYLKIFFLILPLLVVAVVLFVIYFNGRKSSLPVTPVVKPVSKIINLPPSGKK